MQSDWLAGVKEKDRKARKEKIKSFREAFRELDKILEKKKKDAIRDYGPGFTEKQIAVNEWNAAVETLQRLLNVED